MGRKKVKVVNSSEVAITVGQAALTAVPAWLILLLASALGGAYGGLYILRHEAADGLTALSYFLVALASAWALLGNSGPGAAAQVYGLTIVHLLINGAIHAAPDLLDKFGLNTSILLAGPEPDPSTGRPLTNRSEVG